MGRPAPLCQGLFGSDLALKAMVLLQPERVDIDEASGVDGLIVALHVHAAGKAELISKAKPPYPGVPPRLSLSIRLILSIRIARQVEVSGWVPALLTLGP